MFEVIEIFMQIIYDGIVALNDIFYDKCDSYDNIVIILINSKKINKLL